MICIAVALLLSCLLVVAMTEWLLRGKVSVSVALLHTNLLMQC